eukprot:Hpha_TRINITY_DN20126_c0_g1::TRINITY_DN20126_c0_g1_i1::g.82496::m.82496
MPRPGVTLPVRGKQKSPGLIASIPVQWRAAGIAAVALLTIFGIACIPPPDRSRARGKEEKRCPSLLLAVVRNALRERDASDAGVGPPEDVRSMLGAMLPKHASCRAKALGGAVKLAAESRSGEEGTVLMELLAERGLLPASWEPEEEGQGGLSARGSRAVLEAVVTVGQAYADDAFEADDEVGHELVLLPRAAALALLGRPAEATATLEEAIAVHTDIGQTAGQSDLRAPPPHEAILRAAYADLLLSLGKGQEARPMLLRALAWHPRAPHLVRAAARVAGEVPVKEDPLLAAAEGELSASELRKKATEFD